MPTTVNKPGPNSSTEKTDEQATGKTVKVNDGHLFILDDNGHAIAVYAPGRWHSVKVTEEKRA